MCESKTYSVYVVCKNCGYQAMMNIKKGYMVNEEECLNCGCKCLEKNGTTITTTPWIAPSYPQPPYITWYSSNVPPITLCNGDTNGEKA